MTKRKTTLLVAMTGVTFLLLAGIVFSATSTVITVYNTMVKSRVRVDQALSDLESAYQQRYALVDNFVTIVKETKVFEQYQIEVERDLYPRVAEAKAKATRLDVHVPSEVTQRVTNEAQLSNFLLQTLEKLLVLAQHYPVITDPMIKDRPATFAALDGLKHSLGELENAIKDRREQFNLSVRVYNQNIQIFPANLFAASWGFSALSGFEVLSVEARQDAAIAF